MEALSVGRCDWRLNAELSASRGTAKQPYVFRCERCGFITSPTANNDPARIRGRGCRWHSPKVSGFILSDPCWCKGAGDVVQKAIELATRPLPFRGRLLKAAGWIVDRIEAFITKRELAKQPPSESKCGGCEERRVSLNERYPLVWLRRKICPPLIYASEERGDPIEVCLAFAHGFGDAVQFTAVLRHLAKYRPHWRVAIYCKAGSHTLFKDQVTRVGVMDREGLGMVYREDFAMSYGVRWFEPEETFSDSPATKVERCLREEFGIVPDPGLWNYHVNYGAEEYAAATSALEEIADRGPDGRFPVVALHYQGNSFRESKNQDEGLFRDLVDQLKAAGRVPLILDWEEGFRSGILRDRTRGVKCFGQNHPLWKGLGIGDGGNLAAVLAQLELVVGIDSGPEHLASAVGVPTVVVWGKMTHPVNYFSPANNVLHIVRRDQAKYIRGDVETGDRFFRQHYRFHELTKHLRIALPEIVEAQLPAKEVPC